MGARPDFLGPARMELPNRLCRGSRVKNLDAVSAPREGAFRSPNRSRKPICALTRAIRSACRRVHLRPQHADQHVAAQGRRRGDHDRRRRAGRGPRRRPLHDLARSPATRWRSSLWSRSAPSHRGDPVTLRTDIPTRSGVQRVLSVRDAPCVSIYLATSPGTLQTFRLANRLVSTVEVGDRYYVKPLLRAVTFPQAAFVLALAAGGVRLVEILPEGPSSLSAYPGFLPTRPAQPGRLRSPTALRARCSRAARVRRSGCGSTRGRSIGRCAACSPVSSCR